MIKYYCSKHSLNLKGTISRAYGKHKCYCGKSAKFQVEQNEPLEQVVPPLDFPRINAEHLTNATSTPEPDMDDWQYRGKDKANAVKATLYMIAFGGLCYSAYLLATMAT